MHRSRVDAFRHRAAAIMRHPGAGGHVYPGLTLIGPAVIARSTCDEAIQFFLRGSWIASRHRAGEAGPLARNDN